MLEIVSNWVGTLKSAELPVLARSCAALNALRADDDSATPPRIAQLVMQDALLTVKVLRYLQERKGKRRETDITTIAHALMMIGTSRFLENFSDSPTIEHKLAGAPAALHGALTVNSRARHAGLYAHDWAVLRHDVDPEEVTVAALLHDMAEILLWCFAPSLAIEIADMQRRNPALRSRVAQQSVLGFHLVELQLELVTAWQLPSLLHDLIDPHLMQSPRVRNVVLATSIARHSAHGWSNAALPDDFAEVANLLHISPDETRSRVLRIARRAAVEVPWAVIKPAGAYLTPADTGSDATA